MKHHRALALLLVFTVIVGACGDDDDVASTTSSTDSTTTTTTSEPTSTSAAPAGLEQPAIWPAADVVFDTPEAAASDFVTSALGVPASLGEFQQGDSRSGEIVVFSPGEGDAATPVERSILLLRQLGPDDGWFVIGAVNEHMTVDEPASGAQMVAGPLTVEGSARGFEGTVIVSAFRAGSPGDSFDSAITQGGAAADSEPYSVTLDLASASSGDVVTVLVRGGTGLETDPGEFSAIPLVVT